MRRHREAEAQGMAKLLHLNWALMLLIIAVCCIGFLMLYSIAGGRMQPWAEPQMIRFALGFALMFVIAMIPPGFWARVSPLVYLLGLMLLLFVMFFGHTGKGSTRWIDLGPLRLQPSEMMKVALVLALAAYYDWLDDAKISRPLWVLLPLILIALPAALVLKQPDLGTAILLAAAGGAVMFAAGVSLWYFFAAVMGLGGVIALVMLSRGTAYQILDDYQYRRIMTFLDPSNDPLGDGYHITQAKIALGSGGLEGRGYMEGTQSRLNFLPEKHTDFIFTTLAEELGFVGGSILLALYVLLVTLCVLAAISNKNRFGALLTIGIGVNFFFYYAINMAMVMGLAPVVGVPLPMVSYGGSAMLVLLGAFGLVQSAFVHRPREPG